MPKCTKICTLRTLRNPFAPFAVKFSFFNRKVRKGTRKGRKESIFRGSLYTPGSPGALPVPAVVYKKMW